MLQINNNILDFKKFNFIVLLNLLNLFHDKFLDLSYD